MSIFNNVLETIGNTPVIRINKLAPKDTNVYVKFEAFNPGGSIKDRLALGIIEDAERSGSLKPGMTVIEATSGNTGVGLAMVCAQKGYPLVVVMAENCSVERRKLIRYLGAKVVLTPASEKGSGMLNKAEELAKEHGWFLTQQFVNEANANIHSETTAQEIIRDFNNINLDYFVSGFGTGGTLKGISRVLKAKSSTKVAVCEPDNSMMMKSGIPQGEGSHPGFRPHLMQGWAPDFIPKLADDSRQYIDEYVPINGKDALQCCFDLAQKEGIMTGITGGATLAGGLTLAANAPAGSNILCLLPDTGERYLSTPLFYDIPEEMSEEEIAISKSTPHYRFDIPMPKKPQNMNSTETVPVTQEAQEFIKDVLANKQCPVVMFAMEWCEFCWSVRKMFKRLGVEYKSVDLDSVEYQDENWGGLIRAALNAKTGITTIPQIFIGGIFIGGCTETFDAYNSGELQKHFNKHNVDFKEELRVDPYSFLPTWLQPR